MTSNRFNTIQWASLLLPTVMAITMAAFTLSNRNTNLTATTFEKVIQLEAEVDEIKNEVTALDKTKVDKETFHMLIDRLDRIDNKIDALKK